MAKTYQKSAQPRLTAAWVEAEERGIASDFCDRILQERDLPPALLWFYERCTAGDLSVPTKLLTSQERKVLYLISFGFYEKDIAKLLPLSIHTVQKHMRNAKAKLGARTRADMVAIAYRRGEIA